MNRPSPMAGSYSYVFSIVCTYLKNFIKLKVVQNFYVDVNLFLSFQKIVTNNKLDFILCKFILPSNKAVL